ncbi:hypothetical protein [Erythrobacter rubeus]|uniref:Uncharacterized protein n=1 Tax=Erythrobacter rubeus TaxID=2760803 RepID=A0ABR8KQK3_9SPHN|nr:hypothetical protein [Erythrobacter rubeus]MBD2840724.1 hypothetical protein [Erythrobacter rubeus]
MEEDLLISTSGVALSKRNRDGAVEELESLKEIRAIGWEQHAHSFKWLTASLLALNGGGLLAAAQIDGVLVGDRIAAGFSFALGIAFALIVAVVGQRAIAKSFVPIQKQIGYWMRVASDGTRDEVLERELIAESLKIRPLSRTTQAFGWFSAMAFFVALYMLGSGMLNASLSADEPEAEKAVMP